MDLNLLTTLDALLEENSVQAAAERLHLTPPAVSRALARLRATTGDDILVRTGRTMTPTPRAAAIRDEVSGLVAQAHSLLSPARELNLTTLRRTFNVRGHDALLSGLCPSLATLLATDAPGVSLRLLAEAPADTQDLARGKVDLELGDTVPSAPQTRHEIVGADRLVLVMRSGHPLAGTTGPDMVAAADHVVVSRRGRLRDEVDRHLAEQGRRRRVVAAVPTTSLALDVIAHSDLVGVVADRATARARTDLGLDSRALGFALPPVSVVLSWHSRYDTDPAHEWLRGACRSALERSLGAMDTADAPADARA